MLQIFSLIIRYRIPLAVIAAIIAAYGYGLIRHSAGYSKGFAACDAAYIAAEKAKIKVREDKEHEIITLPDIELDERYSRWLRD